MHSYVQLLIVNISVKFIDKISLQPNTVNQLIFNLIWHIVHKIRYTYVHAQLTDFHSYFLEKQKTSSKFLLLNNSNNCHSNYACCTQNRLYSCANIRHCYNNHMKCNYLDNHNAEIRSDNSHK